MNCLTCASHRLSNAAVAFCVLCGAGICLDHMETHEVTTYSLHPGGMVPLRRPDPQPLRVHLCVHCTALMYPGGTKQGPPQDGHRASLLDRLAARGRQAEQLRGLLLPAPEPAG